VPPSGRVRILDETAEIDIPTLPITKVTRPHGVVAELQWKLLSPQIITTQHRQRDTQAILACTRINTITDETQEIERTGVQCRFARHIKSPKNI